MDISLTFRGFDDIDTLSKELGVLFSEYGKKGQDYRGVKGKMLRKSYAIKELKNIDQDDISKEIEKIIAESGGADKVSKARKKFSIESIHMEIYACYEDLKNFGSILISKEASSKISYIGATMGFSWSIEE